MSERPALIGLGRAQKAQASELAQKRREDSKSAALRKRERGQMGERRTTEPETSETNTPEVDFENSAPLERGRKRKKNTPTMSSLIALMELLDVEGFDEYAAALVLRYNRRKADLHGERMRNFEAQKKKLSETMKKLSQDECLIVGKFFAIKEAMAFDAGLRIGLMGRTFKGQLAIDKGDQ